MTGGVRGARKLAGGLLLVLLVASAAASRGELPREGSGCSKRVPAPPSPDAVFTSEVRPILVAHCAPCHEPGGKLYAKLPFDDPAVLSSHEAGVKKRLKGEDLKAFERWLAMAPGKS